MSDRAFKRRQTHSDRLHVEATRQRDHAWLLEDIAWALERGLLVADSLTRDVPGSKREELLAAAVATGVLHDLAREQLAMANALYQNWRNQPVVSIRRAARR